MARVLAKQSRIDERSRIIALFRNPGDAQH
jgi:hypothetical protein